MTYKTHARMGNVFYGLTVLVCSWFGLVYTLPELSKMGLDMVKFAFLTALALFLAYQGNRIGAEFPDYDQKGSIPARRSVFTRFQHKFVTGFLRQGHRAPITHSLDGFLYATLIRYFIYMGLYSVIIKLLTVYAKLSLSKEVITTITVWYGAIVVSHLIGFIFGCLSHWFADMLTQDGVYILSFVPIKFNIVPDNFGIFSWRPFRGKFVTGKKWEKSVYKALGKFTVISWATSFSLFATGIHKAIWNPQSNELIFNVVTFLITWHPKI